MKRGGGGRRGAKESYLCSVGEGRSKISLHDKLPIMLKQSKLSNRLNKQVFATSPNN